MLTEQNASEWKETLVDKALVINAYVKLLRSLSNLRLTPYCSPDSHPNHPPRSLTLHCEVCLRYFYQNPVYNGLCADGL